MGFRFQRRIRLGKGGLGLNLSRSGFSLSQRTSWGSIGPRGISIRTGVPGLSFRIGKRSGGGLVAAIIGLTSLCLYLFAAAIKLGILLAWGTTIAAYWTLVATFQLVRWATMTVYDLIVYLTTRRLPIGDPAPGQIDDGGAMIQVPPIDKSAPFGLAPTSSISTSVPEGSSLSSAPPGPHESLEVTWQRLRLKLVSARGPAARRSVVERTLRTYPIELHDQVLLLASEVEVQAALAKAEGLKGVAPKRRVLSEALNFVRNDPVPDQLQATQIRWLEDALSALGDE